MSMPKGFWTKIGNLVFWAVCQAVLLVGALGMALTNNLAGAFLFFCAAVYSFGRFEDCESIEVDMLSEELRLSQDQKCRERNNGS